MSSSGRLFVSVSFGSNLTAEINRCRQNVKVHCVGSDLVLVFDRKRSRKKTPALMVKDKAVMSGNIDLESSGEFASVEKMLATTDANKFSTYLQTGAADVAAKRGKKTGRHRKDRRLRNTKPQPPLISTSSFADGDRGGAGEEKEGGVREDGKATVPPSKGKKNAYSNSVQKMTCPFCPRVFPWASSLQRHMLTHTGEETWQHNTTTHWQHNTVTTHW